MRQPLRPLPDGVAWQTIFIGRRIYIRRRCLYIHRAMRVHSSPDEYTFPRGAVMNVALRRQFCSPGMFTSAGTMALHTKHQRDKQYCSSRWY